MVEKKFTKKEYLRLYRKGFNDAEAAKELGVTQSAVSRRRRKLDLEPKIPQREWSQEKVVVEIKKFAEEHGGTLRRTQQTLRNKISIRECTERQDNMEQISFLERFNRKFSDKKLEV